MDQGPDFIRDLLILEARGATGQLEVAAGGVHTLLFFVDGRLVYAEGGTLSDTLGRVLVAEGKLTRERYLEVLQGMTDALVEHEEVRFGEVAVRLGYLTPLEVTEGLARQVRSRLLGSLQHERSVRYFDEGSSYTEHLPRFPLELGPVLRAGLHAFYDTARLLAVLRASLDRTWRLKSTQDFGAARFALSREELHVARQLEEPTPVADLIGEPSEPATMRVALLLWLSGLVEDCVPRADPGTRSRSERPPLERAWVEDVADRSLPSVRPAPPAVQEQPPGPPRPNAAELASARARVLRGLAGASGRALASRRGDAADALNALRERRSAPGGAVGARPPGADPRVSAETSLQRGRVELDQGRIGAAHQHFENAYQGHPSDEYGLYLAWTRFLTADPADVASAREGARVSVIACLQADRRMAFAHYVAGRLAFIDDDLEVAERSLRRAVNLDPSIMDATRSLRLVLQRLGPKRS